MYPFLIVAHMCRRRIDWLENKQVVVLKHHPMDLKFTNTYYTSQVEDELSDYEVVDVTSRVRKNKALLSKCPSLYKDVSPFYLGELKTPDGLLAHVFEHFWQASKVFPCHVDEHGNIKEDYWKWREQWFSKEKVTNKSASRRPHSLLGYKDEDCLFSVLYNNGTWERLSYVDARKRIYIPEYAKLVVETASYKWLKKLYDEGKKIALVDFDGYNYYYDQAKEKLYNQYIGRCTKKGINPKASLKDFLNLNTMNEVISCGFTPAGHAFIIKMLLEGDLEVKDGQVIDHRGILTCGGGTSSLPINNRRENNELSC